jgi:hypothetical protein
LKNTKQVNYQNNQMTKILPVFCFSLLGLPLFGQIPNLPDMKRPEAGGFQNYANQNYSNTGVKSNVPATPRNYLSGNLSKAEEQSRRMIMEDMKRAAQEEKQMRELEQYGREEQEFNHIYNLPSLAGKEGAKAYYEAFGKLSSLNADNYSLTEATFIVENAFNGNKQSFAPFKAEIQKTANQLLYKMKAERLDTGDNIAKNITLFKYFSQDTKLKSGNGNSVTTVMHKAYRYDFNDPFGAKDYSKMFVSKLLKTGSGQCHSMPLLYLMLAEEMNTEAYLALAPNHSYVRFADDDGEWKNVELTNGMFSMNTYLLESGYIKSEALQNKIYMSNLSKKELLAQTFSDLAGGYVHKFGYDDFVDAVAAKALELNPNSTSAQMHKANTSKVRFEHTMQGLGINPYNNEDLQRIRNYPIAAAQLNEVNQNVSNLDKLGYEYMPQEVYTGWLSSMKKEENRQQSEAITQKLKEANELKQKQRLEALKYAEEQKKAQEKKQKQKDEQPKYFKIDPNKL